MKKTLYTILAAGLLIFQSCKKSDNPIPYSDLSNFGRGSYISFAEKTSVTYDLTDLEMP